MPVSGPTRPTNPGEGGAASAVHRPLGAGSRALRSVVRVTLAVVIGATLFLMIFEKQLIYYPEAALDVTPKALGLGFDNVEIDVEAGVRIHGWFIPASEQPSAGVVLLSHGNAGNIADRLDRVLSLRRLGVDFFLYDYRGFGRSTGEPDEEGTYRDGRAAYDWLIRERGVEPSRLILMGESLGCAISVQLALDRKAAGLILEAPFASIPHMARAIYPFLPVGALVQTRYDNLAKVRGLKMPLFLVQGAADEVIPPSQGRMVFEAAPEPKSFLRIDGAHHNDVYVVGGEPYRTALAEFIAKAIAAQAGGGLVKPGQP